MTNKIVSRRPVSLVPKNSKGGVPRKVISSVVAVAIVATSVVPAAADNFFFRYKPTAVSWQPGENPEEDLKFGVGNDITIFFTGVIGQPFSKRIPVRTTDVVEWKVSTGALQKGLELDAVNGVLAGTPSGSTKSIEAILLGYDVGGRLIARAAVNQRFVNSTGLDTEFTFYGHTNKYLYREIPATVPVARWESVGDLPEEFSNQGRFLSGTPLKEYNTSVGFIGYDYLGKEVAFTYGDLIVQDNPVFDNVADQFRHPSDQFRVSARPQYEVGQMHYRVVALDGFPQTYSVNSRTGLFTATIPTFNTSMRFKIEGVDADGSIGSTNVFTLKTTSPDVAFRKMQDQYSTVNSPFSMLLQAGDLSGDKNWTVLSGELPDGITLNPETGEISGYPTRVETQNDIVIGVVTSDGGRGQTPAFNFTIYPEEMSVSFKALDTRVGRQFETEGAVMGAGIVSPWSFKLAEGAALAETLDVDFSRLVVSGSVEAAGDHSVSFEFNNGDGRQQTFVQPIAVHDNLSLQYDPEIKVYRRVSANVAPVVTGAIGDSNFELKSGELPEGLAIDSRTGAIAGVAMTLDTSVDLSVSISDESGETVVSNAFEVEVLDRPDVVVSADGVTIQRFVPNEIVAATVENTFDGETYELVAGTLPEGLELESDGVIRGNTTVVPGVFEGLQIKVTDGEGYSALSPLFALTVVEPIDLDALSEDGSSNVYAQWAKNSEFTFALPIPKNAFGSVEHQLLDIPQGVAVVDGQLVGAIGEAGTYALPFSLTDDARRTLTGVFNIEILEPMSASLEGRGKVEDTETDEISFNLPRAGDTIIESSTVNAIGDVTYSFQGNLPAGLVYADGKITGKPRTTDAVGSFVLTLTDEAGSKVDLSAKIVVGERLPLTVTYNIPSPVGLKDRAISPIKPTVLDAVDAVSYSVKGDLPPGVMFDTTTGYFYGVPSAANWFRGIEVTAMDSEGADYAGTFGPFAMFVTLPGNPQMPTTTTFVVRAAEPFERTLEVSNVLPPVAFDTIGGGPLAHGLALDPVLGKISGTLTEPKKYVAGQVFAADSIGREVITTVNLVAVGPVEIGAPAESTFNQYQNVGVQPIATNLIGAATFELAGGSLPSFLSLNPSNGQIAGVAEKKGTWAGLTVKVTDATGASAVSEPFSITVEDRLPLELNTNESYTITANRYYRLSMPINNAVGKVEFNMVGGLPEGISFDAEKGAFFGTAVKLGSYPITMTATDSVGGTVTKSFVFVSLTDGKPINLYVTEFTTIVGEPIATRVPGYSNHIGDVQFWADDTLADYGLVIDPQTGAITGTATQLMDFTPNIHISDETQRVTSRPINIKVLPDIVANVPERIELVVNRSIKPVIRLSVDNAIGSVIWGIEGALPAGMRFTKSSSTFAGTPTEMGEFPIKLTVAEVGGFGRRATVDVKVVIASDGIAPGVRLTPNPFGYYISSGQSTSIYPTYTNGKTGDVVTLAPDSAPLPDGLEIIEQKGKYILYRPSNASARVAATATSTATAAEAGIYPGIKLRVTSVDGLYGDSEPFTIILKNHYYYKSVYVDALAYQPLSIALPQTDNGKGPVGTMSYKLSFTSSGTVRDPLQIDQSTGTISGHVTKTRGMYITAKETYEGKTLRTTYYYVSIRVKATALTVNPSTHIAVTGASYPNNYTTRLVNGTASGVITLEGLVPDGIVVDPVTGVIGGVPTTAGTFPVELVYTDEFQRIVTPLTLKIDRSAAAGQGYKFIKIDMAKTDHVGPIAFFSESGNNINHLMRPLAPRLQAIYKSYVDLYAGGTVFELPNYMSEGSIYVNQHNHKSNTVVYSGSVDGQDWVEFGRFDGRFGPHTVPFKFKGTSVKDLFAFNGNGLPEGMAQIPYTLDLRSLVDYSSLEGVNANQLVWSWELDPNRDVSSTMGQLPDGFSINGSNLRGTSATVGKYAIVLTGAYGGKQVSKAFELDIKELTYSIAMQGDALPAGERWETSYDIDMTQYLTAVGMPLSDVKLYLVDARNVAVKPGDKASSLPPGVTFNGTTRRLTGIPAGVGRYRFAIVATWSTLSAQAEYTIDLTGIPYEQSFVKLSAGADYTCGITTSGKVSCWGRGDRNRRGSMETSNVSVPTDVDGLFKDTRAVDLVAGGDNTCVTTSTGAMMCWGGSGEVTGASASYASVSPNYSAGVTSIGLKAAREHGCYIVNAAVKCQGWNYETGATGAALTETWVYTPTTPSGLGSGQRAVTVGHAHSCSLSTSGAVKCWGSRADGRTGNNTTSAAGTRSPVSVSGLSSGVKQISAGAEYTCALTSSNGVKCWGKNDLGQIGDNTTVTKRIPTDVNGLTSGVKSISAGWNHTCALMNAGTVKCWGQNNNGQLGNGTRINSTVPVDVIGLSNVVEVTAGVGHTCALFGDGSYTCWGQNNFGQLGDGTTVNKNSP